MSVLSVSSFSSGYGAQPVIRHINLHVDAGEVVALFGANGAGKSTTLMAISGVLPTLGGEVRYNDEVMTSPLYQRARKGLSFVTEERSVFKSMSVADNLKVAGVDPAAAIELFPELEKRLDINAGLISGGEQQMLSLARAIARRPTLLFADELSLGLAPMVVTRLFNALRETASSTGAGVLLVEQHVRKALLYVDRVYVMRRGEIHLSLTAAEAHERLGEIEDAYLASGAPEDETSPDRQHDQNIMQRPKEYPREGFEVTAITTAGDTTAGYTIGVDIGGTHTDMIVASASGLTRSKAFTTHDDYSKGILDAIGVAAETLGVQGDDLISGCTAFINSSTIVTNAVTELRGAKVGVLITRGFKDTFRIARGARKNDYDDHVQTTPPEVVARDCIEEVTERVLPDGSAVVALDEQNVREAVRRLKAKGVESIAVCYLWSFVNSTQEIRTREIILEEFPDAIVMLSSEVHPVIRETERFFTTVFNCLSHRGATRFVDQITDELARRGFTGSLSFFQGIGGSVSGEAVKAKPMTMLASGPAGGVMGSAALAKQMGLKDILIGDMGGTSFDTALLHNLEPAIAKRVALGQLQTGVDIIDVVSVGAGGGSLAWIDSRGVPQVGPHSAGSMPGPVCYGRGGTEPTVTDASIVLGLIDPDNYLKGRHQLDRAAAAAAIEQRIAKPLGWTVEQAASGIYDLAVINMANALRTVSIERGYDPRSFSFFAYGGGLGLFAVEVARRLGCPTVVIPDNSSAFSAQGVLMADYVRQYNRTVNWMMIDGSQIERINAIIEEMKAQALIDAANDGITSADLDFAITGDGCFAGQVWEITVPLPNRPLTGADGSAIAGEFPAIYERAYGPGTAWRDSPAMLVNVSVRATYRRPKPHARQADVTPSTPTPISQRSVFLPAERRQENIPVFSEVDLRPGAKVEGPCIIDVGDTTIYIPSNATCERDRFFNFSVTI